MELIKAKKEETQMILEPLQVLVQLSLLSFSPIGTKLSISENELYLQRPYWLQGVLRMYNQDNKDDLYYLYHSIRRFFQWYIVKNNTFFNYLLTKASIGIGKLIETYSQINKKNITHTLSVYKNVLDVKNPELFKDIGNSSKSIDDVFMNITEIYSDELINFLAIVFDLLEKETNVDILNNHIDGINLILKSTNNKIKKWISDNLVC